MSKTTLKISGTVLVSTSVLAGAYGMVYGYAGYVVTGLVFIAVAVILATTGGIFRYLAI